MDPVQLAAALGRVIHKRRKAAGLTCRGLAALAGTTGQNVLFTEKGQAARLGTLVGYARAFGVKPSELLAAAEARLLAERAEVSS